MYFKPRYLPQIEWELYVFSQLIPNGECLEWAGYMNQRGYGSVTRNRIPCEVHRVVFKIVKGKPRKGLVLDHLCRNKLCANPDHLEPVTDRENVLRGSGIAAQLAKRSHCKHGHEFDKINTYFEPKNPNARRCRTCKRINMRIRRLKNVR